MTADEIIARAEVLIQRHSDGRRLQKRARERLRRNIGRRLSRMAVASAVILFALVAVGLAGFPVGTTGVMLAGLAIIATSLLLAVFPQDREPSAEALPTTQLALLPLKTEEWLSTQRLALPAPAARLVDGIGVKLEALVPQLATLDEREPAAAAVRRLIGDELPELVKGYTRVPIALRRVDTDGIIPEKQLLDGLAVVDTELSRMSENLARGDLERLATQGKYLELKYQGDVLS
jgi:hypothetical protein